MFNLNKIVKNLLKNKETSTPLEHKLLESGSLSINTAFDYTRGGVAEVRLQLAPVGETLKEKLRITFTPDEVRTNYYSSNGNMESLLSFGELLNGVAKIKVNVDWEELYSTLISWQQEDKLDRRRREELSIKKEAKALTQEGFTKHPNAKEVFKAIRERARAGEEVKIDTVLIQLKDCDTPTRYSDRAVIRKDEYNGRVEVYFQGKRGWPSEKLSHSSFINVIEARYCKEVTA